MLNVDTPIALSSKYNLNIIKNFKYSGTFEFTHPMSTGNLIEITLSFDEQSAEARVANFMIEVSIFDELTSTSQPSIRPSVKALDTLDQPFNEMKKAITKLLSVIKYHLNHFGIPETLGSIKYKKFGTNFDNLKTVDTTHGDKIQTTFESFSYRSINSVWRGHIQSSFESNAAPLLAMRHLHRAKHELAPHHKWIDATIAAELAIKEVLSRHRPELTSFLLEVPSPPLSKLYGSLCEIYLGERSPYTKKLQTGQEIRNRLVHRPDELHIDQQQANDYVETVSSAIFHILSLIYPNDALIQHSA